MHLDFILTKGKHFYFFKGAHIHFQGLSKCPNVYSNIYFRRLFWITVYTKNHAKKIKVK